jgi:diguanylate cyclase (GGDEF)-like protein/PAS domain S-box-containing protein
MHFVFPHRLANGETRTVEVYSTPVTVGGRPILVAIVHDITDRERADAQIERLLAEQRAVLDSEIVGFVKIEGRTIAWANDAFARMFGYDREELLGQPTRLLYDSDDSHRDFIAGLAATVGRAGAYRTERQQRRKDGSLGWYEINCGVSDTATATGVGMFVDISERKRDAERIETLLREQRAILENDLVGIAIIRDRVIVWANPAYERMLGVGPGQLGGAAIRAHYPSEQAYRDFGAAAYPVIAAGGVFHGHVELVRRDGRHIWIDASGSLHNPDTGEILWGLVEITALVQVERNLKEAQAIAKIGSWDVDLVTHTQSWSDEMCRLYGLPAPPPPDDCVASIHPDDREMFHAALAKAQAERSKLDLTHRVLAADGAVKYVHVVGEFQFAADGSPLRVAGTAQDVTQIKLQELALKQSEQRSTRLAYYDALTDLPNRRMLLERMEQSLSQARRARRSLAIMYLDLDRFKQVNDTFGHEVGDGLLKEVARRLTACVRATDTVARPSGDEFIIVLSEIAEANDAVLVADKILRSLGEPIAVGDQALTITASIGIAIYPVNGAEDARALLNAADTAMYAIKKTGRNGYRLVVADETLWSGIEPAGRD